MRGRGGVEALLIGVSENNKKSYTLSCLILKFKYLYYILLNKSIKNVVDQGIHEAPQLLPLPGEPGGPITQDVRHHAHTHAHAHAPPGGAAMLHQHSVHPHGQHGGVVVGGVGVPTAARPLPDPAEAHHHLKVGLYLIIYPLIGQPLTG